MSYTRCSSQNRVPSKVTIGDATKGLKRYNGVFTEALEFSCTFLNLSHSYRAP